MNTLWFPLGWEPMVLVSLLFFLTECHPRHRDNRGNLSSRCFSSSTCFGSLLTFGVEEDTSYSLDPCVSGFNRCNIVSSSTSFSLSMSPVAGENSVDGTAFCLVTATSGMKLSMLHSITFLHCENLGLSLDGHEEENPSSLHSLPNDDTDGQSSTNVHIDERQVP